MMAERKFVTSILLLALLLLQGCNKKKASLPPKMQAPTVAVVLPDEIPETESPETPAAPVAVAHVVTPPAKTKPKKTPRIVATKKPAPPASTTPAPAAVPPPQPAQNNQQVASLHPPTNPASGGPAETAIVAAMPSAEVMHQKEDTARMVDATENALKGINRQLSDDEKSMRSQIQSYIQQSRKATSDGDFERAYNLAKKAQLPADALTKK